MKKRPTTTSASVHPLIGMWLHTWSDGEIHHQGQVLGVDGDSVIVQLYEFFFGQRSKVEILMKSVVYDAAACTLYPTNEHMLDAYEQFMRRAHPDCFNADLHRHFRATEDAERPQ